MNSYPRRLPFIRLVLIVMLLALFGVLPAVAQEAGGEAILYHDPAGRFTVDVPPGWSDESTPEYGVFDNGSGIKFTVLSVEANDAEAGIDAALAQVAPDVTWEPVQAQVFPAPNGIFTQNIYAGPAGDFTVALAQVEDGRAYVEIFRAVDEAAVQAANADFQSLVLGLTVGERLDLSVQQPAALTDAQLAALTGYVEAQMTRYNIVGASVAVVQNGQIIYTRGFGARSIDGEPVDADTLFMIGSTTKSMTTMMMSTLVDEGALDWDTPVTDILPTFALSDPLVTPVIRVRDLMNNSSGVPRYDMPLIAERMTPDQIIASLKDIPLVSEPGTKFNYSNQMVTTGGYVAALAAGAQLAQGGQAVYDAYVKLMQERVFDPIGMAATTFDFDQAEATDNHAASYVDNPITGERLAVPPGFEQFVVPVTPAGAVWSSAADMARYMQTELSGGIAPDGTRVVSQQNLNETQTPGVTIAGTMSYGMGWMISDYHGQTFITHGGNTIGYTSDFGFLPDANLGVLVLSNVGSANNFAGAVHEYVFETAFGIDHRADNYYWQSQQALVNIFSSALGQFALDENAPASAMAYVGSYEGGLQVDFDDAGTRLLIRAPFGDIPLDAVTNMDGLFITQGAVAGVAAQFATADDGTISVTVAPAVNLGDSDLPKTYQKLS